MSEFSLSRSARGIVVFMGLGLAAMLGTSLLEQANHVSVQEVAPQHQHSQQAEQAGGGMGGMPGMGEIGSLMEQAAKDPNNPALLTRMAESLMHSQNLDAAATFAQRAIAISPTDPHPLYLLGIIRHSQGQHQQAAELLEQVLQLKADPSVRYSLGVLYMHYLKDTERGMGYLNEALNDPTASAELKEAIRKELEHHSAQPVTTSAAPAASDAGQQPAKQ